MNNLNSKNNTHFIFLAILSMVFISAILISDILTYKVIAIFGMTTSMALLIYPISYAVSDIVTECYGRKVSIAILISGLTLELLIDYMISIASTVPNQFNHDYSVAFSIALGPMKTVATGAVIAAFFGYLVNILIMSYFKKSNLIKAFVWRSIISTLLGEAVFLSIAYTIWFWSSDLSAGKIAQMVLVSYIFKLAFSCIYAVIGNYVVKWIKGSLTAS